MATNRKTTFTQEQKDAYVLSYYLAFKSFERRGLTITPETCGKFSMVQSIYAACKSRHEITEDEMRQQILEVFDGRRREVSEDEII